MSITDWLGNETVKILAFEEARELVRKEELGKFKRQWEEWQRPPPFQRTLLSRQEVRGQAVSVVVGLAGPRQSDVRY